MSSLFYLGTAVLSLANGAMILAVNPRRVVNRVFFFVSAWVALWFFCVFMAIREGAQYSEGSADEVLLWLRLSAAVAAFTSWLAWLMRSVLLAKEYSIGQVFRSSWFWFFTSCLIATLAFSEAFIPSDSTPSDTKRGSGYFVYMGAIVISCAYFLYDTLRQMARLTGARKIEMQFFVLNTICACLVMVILNLVGAILEMPWLRRIGPLGFIVLHALTVWAVCSYKVFDARQVISSIGQRALFLCVLGCGAVTVVTALKGRVDHPFDVLLAALLTGVLAILFERPTRKWFGLDPEHLLIAPRRAIIDCARHEADAGRLKLRVEGIIREWCQAGRVELLFEKEGKFVGSQTTLSSEWPVFPALLKNGWITPEFLQRKRPEPGTEVSARWLAANQCGAVLAVPQGSDHPSLVVMLGVKESLRPFTYPDIQLVFPLAELLDNILTHASLAQHAAKLAQIESAAMMSRSLAHDLRNLTTPVVAYLLCAEGRAKPGSPEVEVYEAARHSMKVMDDYIRESLFFSRRLTPEFKEVNPRAALGSVVKLSQDRASERGVTLSLDCDEESEMFADPALFERLALNLVNNAIDASAHGGVVRISSGRKPGKIFLRVEDHGAGILPENLGRVFDPYFTTKDTGDTRRGLGLGLAICRKIVDLHDGDIEVNSIPGRGAVFTAHFPVVQPVRESERLGSDIGKNKNPSTVGIGFVPASLRATGTSS